MQKNYFKHHTIEHICVRHQRRHWLQLQDDIRSNSFYNSIEIQALVMMSTHTHLLCEGRRATQFAWLLQKTLDPTSPTDQLHFAVQSFSQYLNTYRYIYRNPVEAGLCTQVQNYEFSSLTALLGRSPMSLHICDQLNLIHNPRFILNWLNSNNSSFKTNTSIA